MFTVTLIYNSPLGKVTLLQSYIMKQEMATVNGAKLSYSKTSVNPWPRHRFLPMNRHNMRISKCNMAGPNTELLQASMQLICSSRLLAVEFCLLSTNWMTVHSICLSLCTGCALRLTNILNHPVLTMQVIVKGFQYFFTWQSLDGHFSWCQTVSMHWSQNI